MPIEGCIDCANTEMPGAETLEQLQANGFPITLLPLCSACRAQQGWQPEAYLKASHFCTDACRFLDEIAHRRYFALWARLDWLTDTQQKIVRERNRLFTLEKTVDEQRDLYSKAIQYLIDTQSRKGQAG